jgi:UDPglucose 6-dehydrogenase
VAGSSTPAWASAAEVDRVDSDDIRDSPALDVAATIARQGGRVTVYDPKAVANARRKHPELAYAESTTDALRGADLTLLLTEWREFRDIDPAAAKTIVAAPRMVDGRNALDPDSWRAAGWTYRALGRP